MSIWNRILAQKIEIFFFIWLLTIYMQLWVAAIFSIFKEV